MDRCLLVGFPLAYQMPSAFFSTWLGLDQSPVLGAVTATGLYVCQNMDIIVENALTVPGWTKLLIYEHDMIPSHDALRRVACYDDEYDIVGCMYFQRNPPHHANALIEQPDCSFEPISAATVRDWCDVPQLYQVDAVGFGMTAISRRVLEEWDFDNFEMFNTDRTFGSHDLWFCHCARKQGFRVFVDSGNVCHHLGLTEIGLADNQRMNHRKPRAPTLGVPRKPKQR